MRFNSLDELEAVIKEGHYQIDSISSARIVGKSTYKLIIKMEVKLWDGSEFSYQEGTFTVGLPKTAIVKYMVDKTGEDGVETFFPFIELK